MEKLITPLRLWSFSLSFTKDFISVGNSFSADPRYLCLRELGSRCIVNVFFTFDYRSPVRARWNECYLAERVQSHLSTFVGFALVS
jgi:hypothetical protein